MGDAQGILRPCPLPRVDNDFSAHLLRDSTGFIFTFGIHDDDLIRPCHAVQATLNVRCFVAGQDDDREGHCPAPTFVPKVLAAAHTASNGMSRISPVGERTTVT